MNSLEKSLVHASNQATFILQATRSGFSTKQIKAALRGDSEAQREIQAKFIQHYKR